MNYIKRVFYSMRARALKGLFLVAIFTCAFLLVLSAFMVLSGAQQSARQMRSELEASVTITNYATRSDEAFDRNLISLETVQALASHPMVEASHTFAYSTVKASPELRPFAPEEQTEKYFATSFRVESSEDIEAAPEFVTQNHFLLEGALFTPGQTGGVLLSQAVAEQNGLQVGDTVALPSYYDSFGGQTAEAKLTGIYGIVAPQPYTEDPYFNSENLIYCTPDVCAQLNGENQNVYSAVCTLRDPEDAAPFVEELQAMGLSEGPDLRFSVDDSHYRSVKNTLAGMTGIAAAMLAAAVLIGGVVLILLTLISLKGREFEIGVLLSMGEDKWKICAQLVLESLFPVLLSATAALCLAPVAKTGIGRIFTGFVPNLAVTPGVAAALYLAALLLVLAASLVTLYKIWRYQPKAMLLEME